MQTVIAPRGCYLVALAREVDEGEHVEVDDETAESLIEQGWVSLRSQSAKKAARRRAREHATADGDDTDPDEDEDADDEPASTEQPAGAMPAVKE
jgi:hypothetical protein